MRIVFIIDTMLSGGAQKVLLSHARYLSSQKHFVTIVSLKKISQFNIEKNINYIELIPMEEKLTTNIFFILQELSSLVKQSNIVVSFGSFFSMYLVYLLGKLYTKPILICLRTTLSKELPKYKDLQDINFDLIRSIYQSSNIMVQSNSIKNDILEFLKIQNRKIYTLPNPIQLKTVNELPTTINTKDFVCVGRLSKEKNIPLILKAFSLLPLEIRGKTKIHFLGEGILKEELQALTKDLNLQEEVVFHGFIEDPLPFIKKANCLITASIYEGMSNVILEAFSQSTLVLASDIEPNKELIQDSYNGILFQNNNLQSLTDKIKLILTEDKKEYPKVAFKSLQKYQTINQDFESLLYQIINT